MTRIATAGRIAVADLLANPLARNELQQLGVSEQALRTAAGKDAVLLRSEMAGLLGTSPDRFPSELRRLFALTTGGDDLQSMAPVTNASPGGTSVFSTRLDAVQDAHSVATVKATRPVQASPTTTTSPRPPVDLGKPLTIVDNNADFGSKDKSALVYVSAKTVQDVRGKLDQVDIDTSKIPGSYSADDYLGALSALGSYGPLGAYGPLATLGGIGDNSWNPSRWFDSSVVDTTWSMTEGPLSEAGPLGEKGPLSEIYYDGELFKQNEFARHLRGLGLWSVLGPLGPMGPMGAMGPLGPNGAHGFGADRAGNYFNTEGDIQRKVDVWYDKEHTVKREYELFERYTEAQAKSMTDNDTSFMVEGTTSYAGGGDYEVDEFAFTSSSDQLVTIAVVPEKSLDDFDFDVCDQHGNVLLSSDASDTIDWAQLQVPAGTTLSVKVKLGGSGHWLSKDYRLFVTGSGEQLNKSDISGAHIKNLHSGADG